MVARGLFMRLATTFGASLLATLAFAGCGSGGGLRVGGFVNVEVGTTETGVDLPANTRLVHLDGRRPGSPHIAGECHVLNDSIGATIFRPGASPGAAAFEQIVIESGLGIMDVSVVLDDDTFSATANGTTCIVDVFYEDHNSVGFEVDCVVTSETNLTSTAHVVAELDFDGCDGTEGY
jgi:hypothetical protein